MGRYQFFRDNVQEELALIIRSITAIYCLTATLFVGRRDHC